MRFWWLDHLHENFPSTFSNISMEKPPPFFKDITLEIKEWNIAIESWMLPELAKACNKMMIPSILCPWGDSVLHIDAVPFLLI